MALLRAACLQMRSGTQVDENISRACALITRACEQGAHLVTTPEMTSLLDIRPGQSRHQIVHEGEDPALAAFQDLALERQVWLLIGSLPVRHETDPRAANRSFLIDPCGNILARYDKIHMFDVEVGDGQTYEESQAYCPGDKIVLAETDRAKIGLSICYDLRFPYLYRRLAQAGADLICVPSAFTRLTGKAHWHVLLRARAIETGAFVLAPAQGGLHQDGRETFGHALIISPWGEILAELQGTEPGIILADLDLDLVRTVRQRLPSLKADANVPLLRTRTTLESGKPPDS